jgi:HK97 family phage major capsid protein
MNLKDLLAKRTRVWEEMKEIVSRGEWTAEDRTKYDAAEADLKSVSADIDKLERHAELASTLDAPANEPTTTPDAPKRSANEQYTEAFDAFLRHGMAGMEPEQRAVLRGQFVDSKELRAQGISTDAAGGFTVPEGFRNTITETMKFFGGIRQVANVITTTTGQDLVWPSNDDTGNEGAILAENTAVPEQDLTFGQKTLKAHVYTSKLVKVSWQLLQDEEVDLVSYLGRKLGERIGRIHNNHFTVGTGTSQPEGVQTNATVGKTGATGQTTSVTYDDIIDLEHSVDPAYRNERAGYQFHDLTLAKLRKLKDADNRPLWQPSLVAGAPDAFNGRRYVVNNHMPQMAASAKSILFGDFEAGYIIRDVVGIGLVRLDERFADALQVGFFAWARSDGKPDDGAAIRAYQNSAT